jgi:hypothetical protein
MAKKKPAKKKPKKEEKDERPALGDCPLQWWCWNVWCWFMKNNYWRLREAELKLHGEGLDASEGPQTAIWFTTDIGPTMDWSGWSMRIWFRKCEVLIEVNDEYDNWYEYHTFDMNQDTPQDIAAFLRENCLISGPWSAPDRAPYGYQGYPHRLKG